MSTHTHTQAPSVSPHPINDVLAPHVPPPSLPLFSGCHHPLPSSALPSFLPPPSDVTCLFLPFVVSPSLFCSLGGPHSSPATSLPSAVCPPSHQRQHLSPSESSITSAPALRRRRSGCSGKIPVPSHHPRCCVQPCDSVRVQRRRARAWGCANDGFCAFVCVFTQKIEVKLA